MKKCKLLLCIILLLVFSALSLWGEGEIQDVKQKSARMAALGGRHVALADDFYTLFNNPAGFVSVPSELSIVEISTRFSGPVSTITSIVLQVLDGEIPSLEQLKALYTEINLTGPLSIGYVGKQMGFGVFNSSDVIFESRGLTGISVKIIEDMVMTGGIAFRIPLPDDLPLKIDTGFLLKGFIRGEVIFESTPIELFGLIDSFSTDLIVQQPFNFYQGIGFDFGFRFSLFDFLAIGITGTDIYTQASKNAYPSLDDFLNANTNLITNTSFALPIDLSAGVLFTPDLGFLADYISDFKVMLDYTDILDFITHPGTAKNPFLHIALGAEVSLLEILSFRVGLSQGLLAAGVGLDLTLFKLNAAMFGRELSSEPGMRSVFNMMVGIELRY